MIKLDKITEIEIKDGVLTISQFDNNEVILTQDNLKKLLQAINYTHCCKSDSELLRDKKEPTSWDAFLAGYKKRAEMSGLKYDEVSELHAKTLYKCWKSFDLNP